MTAARLGPRQISLEDFEQNQWPPLEQLLWQLLVQQPPQPAAPIRTTEVHSVVYDCIVAGHGPAIYARWQQLLGLYCQQVLMPPVAAAVAAHSGGDSGQLLATVRQALATYQAATDCLKPVLHYLELDTVLAQTILADASVRDALCGALGVAARTPLLVEPELLMHLVTALHRISPRFLDAHQDLQQRFLPRAPTYNDDPYGIAAFAAKQAQQQLQQSAMDLGRPALPNGLSSPEKRQLSDGEGEEHDAEDDRPTKQGRSSGVGTPRRSSVEHLS